MLQQSQHTDPERRRAARESVGDNNTTGNIKLSSTMLFPISTQPTVLMNLKDVPGVLPAGRRYEYQATPNTSVPEYVLKLWRERGYDPAATGIAVVIFHENGRASKPYSYPLYFWSEV